MWTPAIRSSSARDVAAEVGRVPEMPDVELQPERGRPAGVVDQLERLGDRAWRSSTPRRRRAGRARARSACRRARPRRRATRRPSTTVSRARPGRARGPSRSGRRSRARRTRRAGGWTRRARRGAPPDRSGPPSSGSGRIEGIVGTAEAASSPLRSNASSAAASSPSSRELQLPDADAVEPGRRVGGEVLFEARRQRRDLRDREAGRGSTAVAFHVLSHRDRALALVAWRRAWGDRSSHSRSPPGKRSCVSRRPKRSPTPARRSAPVGGSRSSWATSVPEPAPSPGPGQVLAPMCQSRSTGVRWPGRLGNGRQRKFWSRASDPP